MVRLQEPEGFSSDGFMPMLEVTATFSVEPRSESLQPWPAPVSRLKCPLVTRGAL